jgi:lipopolysaccharide transport system permease protein
VEGLTELCYEIQAESIVLPRLMEVRLGPPLISVISSIQPAVLASAIRRPVSVIKAQNKLFNFNLAEILEYRDLLFFMVSRDVTVVYKQTILGFGWAFLTPVLSIVVFTVVFGRLAKVPTDGIPYPIFACVGLLPWTYFSSSLTGSINSLIQSQGIFTKVYFPRIFLPLVPTFSKLVDLAVSFLLLVGLMIWYQVLPTWQMLLLPIPLILMMMTAAGMGLWISGLAVQFRDVKHASPFLIQILMYAAPVVWPVSLVSADWRPWYSLYPMAGVIEGFRAVMLGQSAMPWDLLLGGGIISLILLITGALYFSHLESGLADVA